MNGTNPSGSPTLNSAVLCQNKPILRLLGFWRDELREDKELNGLLSLKLAKKNRKL